MCTLQSNGTPWVQGAPLISNTDICRRIDRALGGTVQAASDWPNGIISTAPFSLPGSRGEYIRVVGIYSDG